MFNELINKDPFFSSHNGEYNYASKVKTIMSLIYHVYYSSKNSYYDVKQPIFKFVTEKEFENKTIWPRGHANEIKTLADNYRDISINQLDKDAAFFYQENIGVFIFVIEFRAGKYTVTKKFIPKNEVIIK